MNRHDDIFESNLEKLLARAPELEVPAEIKARVRKRIFTPPTSKATHLVKLAMAGGIAVCLFLAGYQVGRAQAPAMVAEPVEITHETDLETTGEPEMVVPQIQVIGPRTSEELLSYRVAQAEGYYESGYYLAAIESYKQLYHEFPDKREGVEALRIAGDIYLQELVEPGKASGFYRLYLDLAKAGGYEVADGSASWLLCYMKPDITG